MRYQVHWLRNGVAVGEGERRRVTEADASRRLACQVTARNGAGTAAATSRSKRARSAYVPVPADGGFWLDALRTTPQRSCRGATVVTLLRGSRVVGRRTVSTTPTWRTTRAGGRRLRCRWSSTFRVRRDRLGGARKLKVQERFLGNAFVRGETYVRWVKVPRA